MAIRMVGVGRGGVGEGVVGCGVVRGIIPPSGAVVLNDLHNLLNMHPHPTTRRRDDRAHPAGCIGTKGMVMVEVVVVIVLIVLVLVVLLVVMRMGLGVGGEVVEHGCGCGHLCAHTRWCTSRPPCHLCPPLDNREA